MKNKYDMIVVGAGPAGTTTARYAARQGISVLILEKDRDVGIPVRCAEGASEQGLKSVLPHIEKRWIDNRVSKVLFHSPRDREVELLFPQTGYILNRKLFDADLARMAVEAGAELLTRAYVRDLVHDGGKVTGVKVLIHDKDYQINAKMVVGADGVESRVGRWAGLKTRTLLKDMETCAQYVVGGIDISDQHIHLYFATNLAPQGYLWIFPKGNGIANVGIGISGIAAKHKSPLAYLNEFMNDRFPNASLLSTVVGGVPCDQTLTSIVADGLLLVGDAAHQVNPITGGGIVPVLVAGKIAGEVAAQAVINGDVSAESLMPYPKLWHKAEGKNHRIFYKLKNYVYNLTDEELESIADAGLKVPVEKRTMLTLFRAALVKKPTLILDAVKVFT